MKTTKKKPVAKDDFLFVEFTRPWIHSHNLQPCAADDPTANVTYARKAGEKPHAAAKYATDNYACDVRIRATGEVIHAANWSEARGDPPRIPDTAMFVARACEERLRQQSAANAA